MEKSDEIKIAELVVKFNGMEKRFENFDDFCKELRVKMESEKKELLLIFLTKTQFESFLDSYKDLKRVIYGAIGLILISFFLNLLKWMPIK